MWKMLHWFLILLLTRGSSSQCFTNTDCTGGIILASDEQVCCVETNGGMSFNDGSNCIGLSRQEKLHGFFGQCDYYVTIRGFERTEYDVLEGERLHTTL